MTVFLYLLVAVIGLVFGSFLGALTYRLPKNISIARGRSFCPKCKEKIAWFDNLPLLSFLLLRGKCRNCKKKISWRYFLTELFTALIFVFYFYTISNCDSFLSQSLACTLYRDFNLSGVVISFTLFLITLSIFVVDWETKIIPDELNFWGLVLILPFLILIDHPFVYLFLFAGSIFASLFVFLYLLTSGRGMGLGDAKLVLWLGIFLGWPLGALWLLVAFLTGAVVGIILILLKKASFGKEIPFGPFLIFAFFIVFFFGDKLLQWFPF